MTYTVEHFINGKKYSGDGSKSHDIYNPAQGEVIGQVCFATTAEVNKAVSSAKQAFPAWAATTPIKRARVLFNFKQLLETHKDELAKLVTQEHGKTLEDAAGSVMRGIELVEFACGIPNLLQGTFSENVGTDVDSYTLRQSLGVCAGVSPFNFPVMVPIWMFVSAIACGNTFVLKPSEKDPSVPLRLAELFQEAGLPEGVFNIVNGDKDTVDCLLKHPDIQTMTAVASTPVAEYIYKEAIAHGKRSHTFGGAKNHCVVMPDADIEQVASAILGAAYGSAGERCMAVPVVVAVGDATADKLVATLKKQVPELKVGPGTEPGVEVGPLVTQQHLDSVQAYVDLGVEEGAELVVDGRNLKPKGHEKGFFMGGCLFDKVTPDMRIYKEEIFGPVLAIVRAPDFDTAVKLVNEHEYGNGTAIFTHDGDAARTYASLVQVGMVGINVPIPVPVAYHCFGGWKRSVFGDVNMHGDQSIQFYTKLKTVTQRWFKGVRAGAEFIMPHTN